MSKVWSPDEYLNKVADFLKGIETQPLIKKRITDQEQIVDLFRFWYMDCREQEAMKEAIDRHEHDRFGLGDMLGEE